MFTRDLIGKSVVTLDGLNVGSVEEIEITQDWRAESLVLRLSRDAAKEIGIRFSFKPRGVVSTSLVKGVGDYITLNTDKTNLREALKPLT